MIKLADSEGSDQPAQMRRLILAFAVHIWPDTFSNGAVQLVYTKEPSITKDVWWPYLTPINTSNVNALRDVPMFQNITF